MASEITTEIPTDGLPLRARMLAQVAILAAVGMATLDTAIVNTALPTIASDIGAKDAASIWVVNAYQLTMVATLLPLAGLGEIVGHRRIFMAGVILFTLTSLGCGLAWSLPTLVAARALQGFGAAGIMSVNVALIRFVYPAKMLGRGMGLNALVVAVAFTVGPTVASGILAVATWQWLFLVNVPAGLIALGLSVLALPRTARAKRRFDVIAALLCGGFLALLILGLGALSHGDPIAITVADWSVSALCGYLLVRREAGRAAPILVVDLFRRPAFTLSALTSICSFITQGLAFVSLPFLFQNALGRSQVETGFLMTPWPVVVAIMAPIAGRLSDRYPAGILGSVGLALLSVGMGSLALLPSMPSTVDIAWRMVMCGAGFGFFQSPNLRALMSSAPPSRSGGASGIVATARLMGQSTGAALVALCLTVAGSAGPVVALWLGSAVAILGGVMSVLRLLPQADLGETS